MVVVCYWLVDSVIGGCLLDDGIVRCVCCLGMVGH